jgi:hypothetical protein
LPATHAASEAIVSRVLTPNIQFLGTTFAIITSASKISVTGSRNSRMRALTSASFVVDVLSAGDCFMFIDCLRRTRRIAL